MDIVTAASRGDIGSVRVFLKEGYCPDDQDESGETPLICASYNGHVEVVRLLLEYGAKTDIIAGLVNWTALMGASAEGHVEVVRLLLECGANPNIADEDGKTALVMAAEEDGLMDVVFLLLDYGSDMDFSNIPIETYGELEARERAMRLVGRYPQSLYQKRDRPSSYMNVRYSDISIRWM
jgi:ankyrin repeat protein